MKRPDLKNRQKARKSRNSMEKDSKIGYGLIGFCGLLLAAFIIYLIAKPAPIKRGADNCPSTLTAHTVILIDRTDPFSAGQITTLKDIIAQTEATLELDEKITIYTIEGNARKGLSDPLLSLCRPRDGSQTNQWTENERFIRRNYEDKFATLFRENSQSMLYGKAHEKSPIFEALSSLASKSDFQADLPKRRLIILSDFIQNSHRLNLYDPNWSAQAKEQKFKNIFPVLASVRPVQGSFYIVLRNKPAPMRVQNNPQFYPLWYQWIDEMGIDVQEFMKVT